MSPPFPSRCGPYPYSTVSSFIRGHALLSQGCTVTTTSKEELRERLGPTTDVALVAAVQAIVDEARHVRKMARERALAEFDYAVLHAVFSACGVNDPTFLRFYPSTMIGLLWPLCTKPNSKEELRRVLKVRERLSVSGPSLRHHLISLHYRVSVVVLRFRCRSAPRRCQRRSSASA